MDTYQYDLVKKLSFLRFGGTQSEHKAAEYLMEEIKKCGGEGSMESFFVPACKVKHFSVKIVSPYKKELEALPFGMCGGYTDGGVNLKLFYAEDCSEAALYGKNDLSDTAVLVNGLNYDQYKALCEKNAAAILVISGKWYDCKDNADFLPRQMKPAFLSCGKVPTFFVWAKDAMEMLKNEAEILHLELEQDEFESTSYNVVATIKGTQITDESVVITAHYDSVAVGTGSWDNATGSATVMYIYKHFLKNPPKRTMRFIWCGSEEQGLLGSKAYAKAHSKLVENEIKFGFNFDMCGTILGVNSVCATGGDELKNYAEAFCKEYGINAAVHQDVRSSDSATFADCGIPTLDLIRRTNTVNIHTRYDLIDTISAKQLKKDGDFAVAFIDRVVNSAQIPIKMGMPDSMREKLDKYFWFEKAGKET